MSGDADVTTGTHRFVIYEPTMLVALDLEWCLRDHDPAAVIVLAATLADGLRLIAEGAVTLAILHAGVDQVGTAAVPLLLIGDAAEDRPGPWPVLRRPFTAEDVAAALTRLGVPPQQDCT